MSKPAELGQPRCRRRRDIDGSLWRHWSTVRCPRWPDRSPEQKRDPGRSATSSISCRATRSWREPGSMARFAICQKNSSASECSPACPTPDNDAGTGSRARRAPTPGTAPASRLPAPRAPGPATRAPTDDVEDRAARIARTQRATQARKDIAAAAREMAAAERRVTVARSAFEEAETELHQAEQKLAGAEQRHRTPLRGSKPTPDSSAIPAACGVSGRTQAGAKHSTPLIRRSVLGEDLG